ncbi:MAG: AIR synthase-related protein [Rhizomicrobium sp.]
MKPGDVVIGVRVERGSFQRLFPGAAAWVADSAAAYDAKAPFDPARDLADALLAPTRLYIRSGLAAIRSGGVKGFAHITGGGPHREPAARLARRAQC